MTNFKKKNHNIFYITTTIIILMFFALIYFSSEISNIISKITTNNAKKVVKEKPPIEEKLKITVIDDKRCINCNTKKIVFQLGETSFLSSAIFQTKDFSEKGVKDMLIKNNIKKLPAIIFSNNNVEAGLSKFLEKINDGNYILKTGSSFDPFVKRSNKGFKFIRKDSLDMIKKDSFIKGNKEATITWLEYSDLECPYCAKLHNSDVYLSLKAKYGDNLNQIFNHFPLKFHKNAESGAEILECLGEQKGGKAFYSLIDKSYSNKNSQKDFLINEAVNIGANKQKLEECLNSHKYSNKVDLESKRGAELFGITGTPGNILINNDTLEYDIISGAYPKEAFIKLIDRLLKK